MPDIDLSAKRYAIADADRGQGMPDGPRIAGSDGTPGPGPLRALWRGPYRLSTTFLLLCVPAPLVGAVGLALVVVAIAVGPAADLMPDLQPRRLPAAWPALAAIGGAGSVLLGAASVLAVLAYRSSVHPRGIEGPRMTVGFWLVSVLTLPWWQFVALNCLLAFVVFDDFWSGRRDPPPPFDPFLTARSGAPGPRLPGDARYVHYSESDRHLGDRNHILRSDAVDAWIRDTEPFTLGWTAGTMNRYRGPANPAIGLEWECAQILSGFPVIGSADVRHALAIVCDQDLPPALRRHPAYRSTFGHVELEEGIASRGIIAFPDDGLIWVHDGQYLD